jgi:glyoxylate reductase
MKPKSFLINTARGDLVDDDAVIAAVMAGHLAGIGLDVYRGEPDFDRRYLSLEQAVLLPHLGSATRETREAMGFRVIANLDAFFRGEAVPDRVG